MIHKSNVLREQISIISNSANNGMVFVINKEGLGFYESSSLLLTVLIFLLRFFFLVDKKRLFFVFILLPCTNISNTFYFDCVWTSTVSVKKLFHCNMCLMNNNSVLQV